jgi:ketosteroid isomerase-like protein
MAAAPHGSSEATRRIVAALWRAMDARAWDEVAALLADDVVCDWPVSGERIRGRDNVVAVNRAYPGDWSIRIAQIVAEGNRAASEVEVTLDGRIDVAVSFYEVRGGKIARMVDYWPEPYPAPTWRAQWVEPLRRADPVTPD